MRAPSPIILPAVAATAALLLLLVASAPTAEPGFSPRGLPLHDQILVGSASGNALQDPRPREAVFGHTLAIHRTFWQGDEVLEASQSAALDVAAGRLPWLSFKAPHRPGTSTPYTWTEMAAGAGDSWAADLAGRLATLPGPVWVAIHHEPENDPGSLLAWTQMQRRLSPIFRSQSNIAYTVILMGYPQFLDARADPRFSMERLWPGPDVVDVTGFDPYNWYGTLDQTGARVTTFTELREYFAPISAWAESVGGARWAVSETGLTDLAAARDAGWIRRSFRDLRAFGGIAFVYWDNEFTSEHPANTFALDTPEKQDAFAQVLRQSDRVTDSAPNSNP